MLDRLAAALCRIEKGAPVLNGATYLSAAEREAVDLLVSEGKERLPPGTVASNISYRIDREIARLNPGANLHRTFGLGVVVLPIGELPEASKFSGGYVIDIVDSNLVGKSRDS